MFFGDPSHHLYVVQKELPLSEEDQAKLEWLFGNRAYLRKSFVQAELIGPRINMVTPWSTNAVEICRNMGIHDIIRMEQFWAAGDGADFDNMVHQRFKEIDQHIFDSKRIPDPIKI